MSKSHAPGFPFDGNLYAQLNIGNLIDLPGIQSGFCTVPLDPYVSDNTRYKDICRFVNANGNVAKMPHGELVHPINAATYGGHRSRKYEEIPNTDIHPLQQVVEIFSKIASISSTQEILVQRQRVVAGPDQAAKTVREGAHQDGLKKLAILCISRVNVSGGISFLFDEPRSTIYAGILEPGDILFVDDVQLWHDTTPIRRVDPTRSGYRDVVLLNWPSERVEAHEDAAEDQIPYYGA